ncbi:MAG TPA: acetyl-CoA synthetase, partial [Candidatus Aenigmarchaeota archaeon]|nr:acetyl-CoA synthetase [Candidatus Aenigmarchaeota archaeon]
MAKMSDEETERLLKKFGIPVPDRYIARNEEHAVLYTRKTGFPVVLKISSPDILHKTDAGCVMLDLRSIDQVRYAYDRIM